MGISSSQPSPPACLLSGLYNGTACLALPCFTQENRPHIGAWSNRCPALYQHSASLSLPDSLFMHHGFICFNEKPREKLQIFVFFPGDHFIQCVQIFTLETRPIAETCVKDSSALTWPSSHLRKLVPRHHGRVCQMERCRTRENGKAGYNEWNTMLEAYQLSGCTKPNTSLWALAGNL